MIDRMEPEEAEDQLVRRIGKREEIERQQKKLREERTRNKPQLKKRRRSLRRSSKSQLNQNMRKRSLDTLMRKSWPKEPTRVKRREEQ